MGSIDNDPPAAYRYTEMRLQKLAAAHMVDIRKETVPLVPSYKQDPKVVEPLYLPGRIPPVCFPNQGIAVGQTSVIPPHNLAEVLRACIALLDRPADKKMTVAELMRFVKGPDFPTGGTVLGREGVKDYLATGKGQITVRGEVRLEQTAKGPRLVVTEIPFPGTMSPDKAKVVESIRDAVNEGKVPGVVDLRDESDQDHGIRIVLDVKAAEPTTVLNALYRHTLLQVNVNAVMTFVFGESGERARHARQVGMVELLGYWVQHQLDVVTRRSAFELRQARERLHVVEGLIAGAAHADNIVKIFRKAPDRLTAKAAIAEKYRLSEIQATVIADMTLAQVTRLDAAAYAAEKTELTDRIAALDGLLADPARMRALLKDEMQALIVEFGAERRTRVDTAADRTSQVETVAELAPARPIVVSLADDLIKATAAPSRNGRAATSGNRLTGLHVSASSTDFLLFVTSAGRVCVLPARSVPEIAANQKGEPIRRVLPLDPSDSVRAIVPVADFADDRFLVTFTRAGRVKKTSLAELRGADAAGLLDLKLTGDDAVLDAFQTDGTAQLVVVSSAGKALRFADGDVRPTGRGGQGVQAISLPAGAFLVAALPCQAEDSRELVLRAGDGGEWRVRLAEVPPKERATAGIHVAPKGKSVVVLAFPIAEANGRRPRSS